MKDHQITISIPQQLLAWIQKCQAFLQWAEEKPITETQSLESLIIEQLEGHCECIEADIVTDAEGGFLADKIWLSPSADCN
jgi:hypothetical protein